MIPSPTITAWSVDHPWPKADQVEQDLLLAQAMCEIANDPQLGEELVLRGGTALHKLFFEKPYRYSEDLDYTRTSPGGIGPIFDKLRELGKKMGYDVSIKNGEHPKVYWRYRSNSDARRKIKIEINTRDRNHVDPLQEKTLSISTNWIEQSASIRTFSLDELIATKIRALYQRRKGRDLFDIWLALENNLINTDHVAHIFEMYRPENTSGSQLIDNLQQKLHDYDFCHDCNHLIYGGVETLGYDVNSAARRTTDELLVKL